MSNFGSIHTAARMNAYVKDTVAQEVNRLAPRPRTATVVEIRERECLVTYTGENTVVKVPYNNLAPSYEGQVVLIDGPMGDRRIVEVMGRTSIESRINDNENFQFSPPLWMQSMMEYPETYPTLLTNDVVELGTTWVNATPMIVPRATAVSRLEIRLRETVSNANIKLSIYKVNPMFTQLQHVQTATVSANNLKPGFDLNSPLIVERDDVLCVVASKVSGNAVYASAVSHPEMPMSRSGQFTMGNFNPSYQGNDVDSNLITPVNNRFHMYAVGLSYIPE